MSLQDPDRRKKAMTIRSAAYKQKRLLHDVDRGRPCLKCQDECPGFHMHFWRKVCVNCNCTREDHAIDLAPEKQRPMRPWAPEELAAQADRELNQKTRKAIEHQDPLHDHNLDACVSVKPEHVEAYQTLREKREKTFAKAELVPVEDKKTCGRCQKNIGQTEDALFARCVNTHFHSACFSCASCKQVLADEAYYYIEQEQEIFCGRCHAEKFLPRCSGCQELIFDPTYTKAEDATWHITHFCCQLCDVNICNTKYCKTADGLCVCLECYESVFAETCSTCNVKLQPTDPAVKIGEGIFHQTEACLKCKVCAKVLLEDKCVFSNGELLCEDDYKAKNVKPCGRCKEPVTGKYIQVQSKRFHSTPECFSCVTCKTPLQTKGGDKPAYPIDNELYCYDHAIEKKLEQSRDAQA